MTFSHSVTFFDNNCYDFQSARFVIFVVYESAKDSEVCSVEELQVAAAEAAPGAPTHRLYCPVFLFVSRKHGPKNVWRIDVSTVNMARLTTVTASKIFVFTCFYSLFYN